MNYFFYVEDSKAGREMFEFMIKYLLVGHTRVRNISLIQTNNYVVESGYGYPSMIGTREACATKNRLGIIIDEINRHGNIDCLVLCLDTDGETESKIARSERNIHTYKNKLRCPYQIFVQNVCAETWLLGIDHLFPSVYRYEFEAYVNHYNVLRRDPEKMDKPAHYTQTLAIYHFEYLREMARQRAVTVSKSNCRALLNKHNINRLIHRVDHTNHLASFARFLDFLRGCR